MKQPNSFFLMGVLTAAFAIAVFSGNSFLRSGFADDGRGLLPRELRLGNEIGIIQTEELNKTRLNRSISNHVFAEKIHIVLDLLGAQTADSPEELTKAGLLKKKKKLATVTRLEALETFARVSLHLQNKGMLVIPEAKAKNYRDYKVTEKYNAAVAYLQSKFVIRGYPDGTLGTQKRLNNREAIFFLYRFYEAVSSDMMSKRTAEGIRFIDIPLSHPLMEAIRNLTQAGAFDKIMLRPSFDGESLVSVNDLIEINSGICSKAGKEIDLIRVKTIFAESSPAGTAKRKHLALMMEYLLETFARERLNAEKISYTDVTIDQPEYEALLKIAGCGVTMGNGNNIFAGNDSINWYETTKILNEILKYAELSAPEKNKPSRLAEKGDVENLKALIRAKREKIRQILNRE